MTYIEDIPEDKLRAFAKSLHERFVNQKGITSKALHDISKLRRELGIQEDGFRDTPSLNRIFFDDDGRPYCEEHGVMNRYEHRTHRCVMCGVAISMQNRRAIVI